MAQQAELPLPRLDIGSILTSSSSPPTPSFNPSATPISIDVLCISGRSASPISSHQHIFYDSELRAIVYRSKDIRSGLATTTLWTWKGSNAVSGDAEEWKIRDLESRFSTKAVSLFFTAALNQTYCLDTSHHLFRSGASKGVNHMI